MKRKPRANESADAERALGPPRRKYATIAPQNTYFPGAYDCTLYKPQSQLQIVTCANATKGLAMVLQSHSTLNTTVDSASCGPEVS